jgi:Derlin-2/3
MDTNSPEAWFKSLPPVTRSLLVAMFSSTCLVVMGVMNPRWIMLDWSLVTEKYAVYHLLPDFTSDIIFGGFYRRGSSWEDSRSGL